MTLRDHSACGDECYPCRIRSVGIMASALPTRNPIVKRTVEREKVLVKDRTAFKSMRDQGLQPARLRGAAELARYAESKEEVETGRLIPAPIRDKVIETRKAIAAEGL